MLSDIQSLLKSRKHCVMATVNGDRPYCSLMAYTTDDPVTRLYMITQRNTRKFRNLNDNPRVSLLVDSRGTSRPQALTIEGVFEEVTDAGRIQEIHDLFMAAHPGMQSFMDHPDAAFIQVIIQSALFLNGLTDARYVDFTR